jgi:hypothetical protein
MRLVGTLVRFLGSNRTEFGLEIVGRHERAHEIREDLKADVNSRCVGEIVVFQRVNEACAHLPLPMHSVL